MRKLSILIGILALLLGSGCRGRTDDPQAPTKEETTETAAPKAPSAPEFEICPECAGLGRSPHSGDERPCFLCDGDGRCAICGGKGHHRDGACSSCDGTGQCLDCSGDGIISSMTHDPGSLRSPIPGDCPVCLHAFGVCPECGGAGVLPSGRTCVFCDGERWCPECRGSGTHRLCGGSGICPLCRGRGALLDGAPAPRRPTLVIHFKDGKRVDATLLDPPGRMLSIEPRKASRSEREAISLNAIEPNDVLLAFRMFADQSSPALRIAAARFALSAGIDFLSAARHDALVAQADGASPGRIELLLARIDGPRAQWLEEQAASAMAGDPERAWVLLKTRLNVFPGRAGTAKLTRLLEQAAARIAGADADLSPEVLERRHVAETARLQRTERRGREWRVRAEDLMARTGASVDDFLRAHRAALESWLLLRRAANRADPALRASLLDSSRRSRLLRVRALIGLAARLLEQDHRERARSLGMVALSLDADDSGAAEFLAEVEGALGRRAMEVEDR